MPKNQNSKLEEAKKKRLEAKKEKILSYSTKNEAQLIEEMKRIRKSQFFTQAELAELSDCSQQVISDTETKKSSLTLKTFCKIAASLGYEIQIKKRTRYSSLNKKEEVTNE